MFRRQSRAPSNHHAVLKRRQSRLRLVPGAAPCAKMMAGAVGPAVSLEAETELTAVAGAVSSTSTKVVKRSQVRAVLSSAPSLLPKGTKALRRTRVLFSAHGAHDSTARPQSPVKPRPNLSVESDTQRHCPTWPAGEHRPCGAMPLSAAHL